MVLDSSAPVGLDLVYGRRETFTVEVRGADGGPRDNSAAVGAFMRLDWRHRPGPYRADASTGEVAWDLDGTVAIDLSDPTLESMPTDGRVVEYVVGLDLANGDTTPLVRGRVFFRDRAGWHEEDGAFGTGTAGGGTLVLRNAPAVISTGSSGGSTSDGDAPDLVAIYEAALEA